MIAMGITQPPGVLHSKDGGQYLAHTADEGETHSRIQFANGCSHMIIFAWYTRKRMNSTLAQTTCANVAAHRKPRQHNR